MVTPTRSDYQRMEDATVCSLCEEEFQDGQVSDGLVTRANESHC